MRPHRLRVSAFGPFPGTVEVDLDALAASGLFLLQGETGSGKTTLLDALGYALYGRVPGVRNKAGRLRSDHAAADLRTSVQLEVTLSGRRLRLTRSPAQERPKARGTGTTTEPAKVLLEERDAAGTWHGVSTRAGEADQEVKDLVGMSADQFFQVVLLPQGDFARFLRAEADERRKLLEALFGTHRFAQAEGWLAEQRRATGAAAAAAGEAVRQAVALVRSAAGRPVDDAEPLTAPEAALLLDAARSELEVATALAESAQSARDLARAAAQQAERHAALQQRRADALARRERADAAAGELAGLRAELDAAARAAPVAPVLLEARRRAGRATAAAEAVAAALARLETGVVPTVPLLQEREEVLGRRRGRLEELRAVEASLADDLAAARVGHEEARRCAARADVLGGLLAELPGRRSALTTALAAGRAAEVRLPAVQAEAVALRVAVADLTTLLAARAQHAGLREELLLARETHQSLREKANDVREARLDDIRFELAAMLVDDDECPVCGSLDHPAPAEVRGERVTRDDEDRAVREAEDAGRVVQDLSAALSAAQATAEQLQERLGEQVDLGLEGVRARLAAAGEEEDALARQASRVELQAGELARLEQEQADAETERAGLAEQRTAAERRATEAQERADRTAARLHAELAGAADLDEALRAAAAEAAACAAARQALEEAARAGAEADRAQEALVAAATAAGFPGVEQAGAAVRPAPRVADVQQRLRAADDERAAVEALLADPALDVALVPAADTEGTAQALRLADAALAGAVAARTSAADRAADLGALVPALHDALDARAPLQARADEVRRMADLVAGGGANQLRMTLSSYVLAARLEEVAAAASERLLRMSQGRYSLVHSDGVKGGARSGLGLLARDTWTGHDRDTSTLSGGETFLASLALALGLADVVTAEAGGARIEALFVDEGFGTLDEQTLDEVMDVLDGLREGGRVVGLVSHVAELKQRIPAQLRVHKGRQGSTASLTGC